MSSRSLARAQAPAPPVGRHGRGRQVLRDRHVTEPGGRPIAGHVRDPGTHRVVHARDFIRGTGDPHRARSNRRGAEDHLQQLGRGGVGHGRETDHLLGTDTQADTVDAPPHEFLDHEHRLRSPGGRGTRSRLRPRPRPHPRRRRHRRERMLLVERRACQRGGHPAIAEDRRPVDDREHLRDAVAHHEHTLALIGEPARQLQHAHRVRRTERGGGLVEHENVRRTRHGERTRDREHRPVGEGERAHRQVGARLDPEALEERCRARVDGTPVDPFHPASRETRAQGHVLGHRADAS